jgi:hypothetical protein
MFGAQCDFVAIVYGINDVMEMRSRPLDPPPFDVEFRIVLGHRLLLSSRQRALLHAVKNHESFDLRYISLTIARYQPVTPQTRLASVDPRLSDRRHGAAKFGACHHLRRRAKPSPVPGWSSAEF